MYYPLSSCVCETEYNAMPQPSSAGKWSCTYQTVDPMWHGA